jgi:hypothetical protein
MTPRLSFLGAARTVTRSCYLLGYDGGCVLIDCGLFQGSNSLKQLNYRPFPFDPAKLDAVLLRTPVSTTAAWLVEKKYRKICAIEHGLGDAAEHQLAHSASPVPAQHQQLGIARMGRLHQNAVGRAPIMGDEHPAGLCPMPSQLMGERLEAVRDSLVVLLDADDPLCFFQEGHGSRDGSCRFTTFLPADHHSSGEAAGRLRRDNQQRPTASKQQLLGKIRRQPVRRFCAAKHYKIVVTRPKQ